MPDFSRVRKLIQEQMVENALPSISVAVARRGEILWEEGFGWADRENRIPATEHTMYYLASVTKTITATAVMVLRERRHLDLDRPVNDYLGSARVSSPVWNPAEATVRRVATHTAGLTTFAQSFQASQPGYRASLDETIRRYGILFWPPGDHFDYSNLGYGILGEVIARVSGKPCADFLRDEVFWPLGMTRASLGIGPGLEKYAAARYRGGSGRTPQMESATPGASAAYCSAHDLALFGLFHLKARLPTQKAILSDASIDTMQNATVSTGGGRYGLGWWIDENRYGYRSALAQGGTDDASAWLRLIPSEGIAVVVLVNTGTSRAGEIVDEALSALLPAYREKRERAAGGEPPRRPSAAPLPPSLVGKWAGRIQTYRGDVPLTFSIAESGDVHARLGSQLETLLNNARFNGQRLTGRMMGNLGTDEDTGPGPYDLDVYLYLRGEAFNGAVTTRGSARLSYWVELKKEGVSP
jgi:CubicO group peptidase (beta-lactamase class C family)